MGRGVEMDFSSFMCVILMLIGVMMIMLISNVLTIISNPENVQISSVIERATYSGDGKTDDSLNLVPKFMNKHKNPTYIDVYRDRIIIYPEQTIVQAGEIAQEGNAFEKTLNAIADNADAEYIVLLARPRSASLFRRLRAAIKDRGVDVGFELYEANRPVNLGLARADRPSAPEKPAAKQPAEATNAPPAEKKG
jgi:hypothetical protein